MSLQFASQLKFKSIYASGIISSQFVFLLKSANIQIDICEFSPYKTTGIHDSLIVIDYVKEGKRISKEFLDRLHPSNAVCFLNVDLTDDFFSDELIYNIFPIEIKKEKIGKGFMNLQRNERLWIYAKSQSLMKAPRFFKMEKVLPRCGIRAYVEESSLADGVELFRACAQKRKVKELQAQVDRLSKIFACSGSLAADSLLETETDVTTYIRLLEQVKDKYLVLFCVRDTPGDYLPEKALSAVRDFGFSHFSKELWRMYIGVSNCGEILCDEAGEAREAPVHYRREGKPALTLSSLAWRQGNKAEILIDGVDYAVNVRGLNIVVYDIQNNKLIDSVGFDYHGPRAVCRRK